MATVNVKRLYYAPVTKDEVGTGNLTFGTPVYIPGIRSFTATTNAATDKLYAEGKVWDQDTTLGDITIALNVADLTNLEYNTLLGHTLAEEGGTYAKDSDVAPYVAILIESEKSNKETTYRVYYKGKFAEPNDSANGKEDRVDYQTKDLTGIFQALKHNGMWKYKVDTDDEDCPSDIADSFFASVIVPTKKVVTP